MLDFINLINGVLWGNLLIYLLLGTGIFFTVRLGFIQFRHFGHTFTVLRHSRKSSSHGISSFQALCTSLAARVGTGNLAGVATAIIAGGPGAVFWMWLIALIGMATSFAESTLAQVYKVEDDQGLYRGGPAYYMEAGLGKRWMGILFAIALILCFGLVFNAVQAHEISKAMEQAFEVPRIVSAGVMVVLAGFIVFGGMRTIARFAELVVPVMALAYIIIAFGVVLFNIDQMPRVLSNIIGSAFGWHEAGAGALGYTVMAAMMNGIKRGLFSNEAGMGSAPNAAASAEPYPPHPASQGYVQMLGVFIDTLVICTATAAVILIADTSGADGVSGVQLTQLALSSLVGNWGAGFVAVALLFFAFTSIVANYAYAESNLVFLEHKHLAGLNLFRLFVLGMVVFGALAQSDLVWSLADTSMGLMAIINLVAILLLSKVVVTLARDYHQQQREGKVPTFDRKQFPELDKQIAPGVWENKN
ncbi:alanine:cation symporter family protein [Corallincola holothuriorum]|uniref:Alanine:cation symporter family protein n=1 Tax=Corallincola holothuriorum TaxID=2282215 RepID=A0A368NQR1_9GAMM|nr:sodium:alanine symporter family protein [Corallincola holothuriorum]RCU51819.1 alanine:cation symporter family protein [Corallincola holothuriorum]